MATERLKKCAALTFRPGMSKSPICFEGGNIGSPSERSLRAGSWQGNGEAWDNAVGNFKQTAVFDFHADLLFFNDIDISKIICYNITLFVEVWQTKEECMKK